MAKISLPNGAQELLQSFVRSPKNFLVFCGNPGIGKTYFCACLTEWALTTFNTFRYYKEADLFQRLRDVISDGKGDYLKALTLLLDDDLIILDDLGSQGVNEWREEVIFDAIDQRYNSMKPTIITSNFSRSDFVKNYHSRLMSRIFAKENIIIEIHEGADLRCEGK